MFRKNIEISLFSLTILGQCLYAKPIKKVKQNIGYSEILKLTGKFASVIVVALVTSENCIVDQKQSTRYIDTSELQRSCADIIEEMFVKGKYKIGFAVPRKNQTLTGMFQAIISGFQRTRQLFNNMSESRLVFGVKIEAERWIQEVDNILKCIPYTRRHISPSYDGDYFIDKIILAQL